MKKGWMLSSFVLLFIISNNVKAQTDGKIVVNLAQKGAVVSSFICVVFLVRLIVQKRNPKSHPSK